MKVGILTFHGADNYGAVLQAFALQEYIRSLNNDVDMVNYSPKAVLKDYKTFSFAFSNTFTGVKKYLLHPLILLRRFIRIIPFTRRAKKFDNFRKCFFDLSEPSYTDIEKIPQDYDAYVIGSDQVWNTKISQDGEPVYFGKFKKNINSICISYAASAGDCEELLNTSESFDDFDAISVREISLKNLLQSKFNIASEIVADPTLLVEPEVWNQVAATSTYNTPEKYVLVYMVYYTEKALSIAKKIARKKNMKVLIIDFCRITKNHFISPIGPEDFVSLFKNASYVVTTSFHGTVFSVIFNRNFYFVSTKRKGENRVRLLLNDLKLEHRIIDDTPELKPIDYAYAMKILPELRASSEAFLQKTLIKKE